MNKLPLWLFLCVVVTRGHEHDETTPKYPLICKPTSVMSQDYCKEECLSDGQCQQNNTDSSLIMCCHFGCSRFCAQPVRLGRCPVPTGGVCSHDCKWDENCEGDHKCCYNGCGKTCAKLIPCEKTKCLTFCRYKENTKLDKDGCATCYCFHPCEVAKCKIGEICEVREDTNMSESTAVCVKNKFRCPVAGTEAHLTNSIVFNCGLDEYDKPRSCPDGFDCYTEAHNEYAICCPELKCDISYCPLGRVYRNGVRQCECFDPCKGVHCEPGKLCVATTEVCDASPCPTIALCEACPPVKCDINCSYGLGHNGHNCPMCRCFEPALECSAYSVNCTKECGSNCTGDTCSFLCARCQRCSADSPLAHCPPKKPCKVLCGDGYQNDTNGRQTCLCVTHNNNCTLPSSCSVVCEEGYALDSSNCPRCLCNDENLCPTLHCNLKCPNGYIHDSNNCTICRCYRENSTYPALHDCRLSCPDGYVEDDDGCPTCECKCRLSQTHCKEECYREYVTLEGSGCPLCRCEEHAQQQDYVIGSDNNC